MQHSQIRQVRALLRQFVRKLNHQLRSTRYCNQVTLAQCHVLLELETMGSSTINDIAQAQGLDKSTISRTAEGLVKKKLITREQDQMDRRYVKIQLTQAGKTLCDQINKESDDYYQRVFAEINPQQQTEVVQGLEHFIQAVKAIQKKDSA